MPKFHDSGVSFSGYLLGLSSPTLPNAVRVASLLPLGQLVKATALGASDYYGYLSDLCTPGVFNDAGRRGEWRRAWSGAVRSTMADNGRVKEVVVRLGEVGCVVGVEGCREAWECVREGLRGREGMEKECFNEKGGRKGLREVVAMKGHWFKGVRDEVKDCRERKRKIMGEEGAKKAMKIVGEWDGKEVRRRRMEKREETWAIDGEGEDSDEDEDEVHAE
ncbi:hypothetical protein TrCOL_g12607 [Triparma columacea]|uniref:Uncharacterized protein n=1 Tax=Triparma columacea TaxID=722753 RepID=A0A9W7LG15_9STRA|nr:hypothetical protein TrCOL_g12607 [Triparma columacea]